LLCCIGAATEDPDDLGRRRFCFRSEGLGESVFLSEGT
jgi:hypothetical protein